MSTKQTEALKLALDWYDSGNENPDDFANMIKQVIALAQQPAQQQEPVTILPDGSAFAVVSYPLPKEHWLYAERQYEEGAEEPIELGKPILTHALRDAVVAAVRYAIRGATNCGKESDFDPDALVQNAVYALCGPFTSPQPAQQQEPLAVYVGETWCGSVVRLYEELPLETPLYTSPPASKPWVGLTEEEVDECYYWKGRQWTTDELVRHVEAKLREKNA